MSRSISKLQWPIVLIAALSAFPQDAKAACDDPLATQLRQAVAHFKQVGDCDLLPGIMALSDRHFAYGFGRCPKWHRTKSHAQAERELRAFCKPSATKSAAVNNNSSNQQQQQASPSPNQQPAPQQNPPAPNQQSVSCSSTITGPNMPPSSATNCQKGNSLLAAARAVRTQNPTAAAETYREAANAYRSAGDIALANKTLEEALSVVVASMPNQPPEVEDPVEELAKKRPLPDLPPPPSQPQASGPGKQSSAPDPVKKTDVDPNDSSFPTSEPALCGGGVEKSHERTYGPNGPYDITCLVAKNNCSYLVRFRYRTSKTRCPPNATPEDLKDPNKKINCIFEVPADPGKRSSKICTTDEGEEIYNYGFYRPQ